VRILALFAVLLLSLSTGCNDKFQATCTGDGQCGSGQVCNTAVMGGVCSTKCSALSMTPGDGNMPSEADQFCRTQLGTDSDDAGGVVWSCGATSGTCYRSNACTTDADCIDGTLCNTTVNGAMIDSTQLFTCLPSCKTNASACPGGTVCDSGTGKCIKGCETDPTQCTNGQVCQVKVSTPAMCTDSCASGFDCSAQGQFKCDMSTGLCQPGCDNDAACMGGKVCMLTEMANPAKKNNCWAPCNAARGATPCSLFNGNGATFMCDSTGHCVAQ
jgi:hypothetical protein